jgi:hypothetical protein
MTIGVVEVKAAATVKMVDFAAAPVGEVGEERDTGFANPGEGGIKLGVTHQEGVVLRVEGRGVSKSRELPHC